LKAAAVRFTDSTMIVTAFPSSQLLGYFQSSALRTQLNPLTELLPVRFSSSCWLSRITSIN
jgi:hypothetical protein